MPSRKTNRTSLAALVCALALMATGCHEQAVKASPPVASAPMPQPADSKPLTTIAPDTDATPPEVVESPPATPPPASVATLSIPPARSKPNPPPRKQPVESAQADSPEQPSRPPAPQISPQLSPHDQASFEQKTNDDVSVAEKNLQQVNDKQLSAAQHDLVEKIRSFLAQSREASKAGDWARAQNLAQKARLLSVELVDSL